MDHQSVAQALRAIATTDQGAAHLRALNPTKADLVAVASHLGMTRVDRLTATALRDRIVQQAIGARNKFAGLRQGWQR